MILLVSCTRPIMPFSCPQPRRNCATKLQSAGETKRGAPNSRLVFMTPSNAGQLVLPMTRISQTVCSTLVPGKKLAFYVSSTLCIMRYLWCTGTIRISATVTRPRSSGQRSKAHPTPLILLGTCKLWYDLPTEVLLLLRYNLGLFNSNVNSRNRRATRTLYLQYYRCPSATMITSH